jgi:hypothetical protein
MVALHQTKTKRGILNLKTVVERLRSSNIGGYFLYGGVQDGR